MLKMNDGIVNVRSCVYRTPIRRTGYSKVKGALQAANIVHIIQDALFQRQFASRRIYAENKER